MADPCVRKATLPLPVMAPQKRVATEQEGNIPEKKIRTIAEDDLQLSDSDTVTETDKSVKDLLHAMFEEIAKDKEEIGTEQTVMTITNSVDEKTDQDNNGPNKEKKLKMIRRE